MKKESETTAIQPVEQHVVRGNPFAVEYHTEQRALVEVESARAVAEVQSRLTIAKKFTRDTVSAWQRIMQSCKRPGLAEKAMYQYPRGGQTVRGPSIRLAEELARSWGNIDCGIAELSRTNGSSEVEAYCWDLETNTRFSMRFTVRHIRDKQGGGVALTDERDIYEMIANMGARRKRACILATIPGDVIADAIDECANTIANGGGETITDRAKKMVYAFGQIGINDGVLVQYLGHAIGQIIPDELVTLRGIYQSIRDGQSKASDWFGKSSIESEDKKPNAAASVKRMAEEAKAGRDGNGGQQASTRPDNGDPLAPLMDELEQLTDKTAVEAVQKRWLSKADEAIHGDIKAVVSARMKALDRPS